MDTSIIQKTISWINDTFVPRGLEPIEDLPEAIPGKSKYCVIAQVLKSNWAYVSVGGDVVDLRMNYEYGNKVGWDNIRGHVVGDDNTDHYRMHNRLRDESLIDIPLDVSKFISDFDSGIYPELIDMDGVELHWQGNEDYISQLKTIKTIMNENSGGVTL